MCSLVPFWQAFTHQHRGTQHFSGKHHQTPSTNLEDVAKEKKKTLQKDSKSASEIIHGPVWEGKRERKGQKSVQLFQQTTFFSCTLQMLLLDHNLKRTCYTVM